MFSKLKVLKRRHFKTNNAAEQEPSKLFEKIVGQLTKPGEENSDKLINLKSNEIKWDKVKATLEEIRDAPQCKQIFLHKGGEDVYKQNILMVLLQCQPCLELVDLILVACPDAINQNDMDGETPLHFGMKSGAALDVIQIVLAANPNAAKEKSITGMTPLHLGMENGAALAVIQFVLAANPDAATEKDGDDRTPLHLGMENRAALDVIQIVLAANPNAAKEKDIIGMTTLHCGMRSGAALDAIQSVLAANPDATTEKDIIGGRTPLHLGMENRAALEVIQSVLEANPNAATEKDDDDRTPLHLGMENRAALDVIQIVLAANPNAAKEKNNYDRTPLHLGMKNGAPLDVIQIVLAANPDAAKVKDIDGRTPLHLGMENGAALDVIQSVLAANPNAAKDKNINGMTPLHGGVENGAALDVIQAVLAANPNAAKENNNQGMTPLHLGMENGAALAVIQSVLAANPDAATEKDDDDRTPLHLGMENGAALAVIQFVLAANPNAAKEKDIEGRTPLHLGIENGAAFDVIQIVLAANPNAAKEKNSNGRTPLHLGMKNGAALDVIQIVLAANPDAANKNGIDGRRPLLLYLYALDKENPAPSTFLQKYCGMLRAFSMSSPPEWRFFRSLFEYEDNVGSTAFTCFTSRIQKYEAIINFAEVEEEAKRNGAAISQFFRQGLHNGRPLSKLCCLDNVYKLMMFLFVFANEHKSNADCYDIVIDLNEKPIADWLLLEVLVDLQTEDAADIFFQIERQQDRKHIRLRKKSGEGVIAFQLLAKVTEETWREVAERARVSNIRKVREWGETYGRFLGKYLFDGIKHRSATCVVVFATELIESDPEGTKKKIPTKVALKFMADDTAVKREIEKRKEISKMNRKSVTSKSDDCVALVKDAFTVDKQMNLQCMTFHQDMAAEISRNSGELYLNSANDGGKGEEKQELRHLLVMECGSGLDLYDIISHQDIAKANLMMVLHVAVSIGKILQVLNEECCIMHGDVKARNFVSLGVGGQYMAIDLDNASLIDEENAGNKVTSSGYLPPEQAAIVHFNISQEAEAANGSSQEDLIALQTRHEKLAAEIGKFNYGTPRFNEILGELQDIDKKKKELENKDKPQPVVATKQYDMWCYGVMLYQLCTNLQLFSVDGAEQTKDIAALEEIRDWSQADFDKKLKYVRDDGGWKVFVPLLKQLLQPDPSKRPQNWSSILENLEGRLDESQINDMLGTISRIEKSINNIPKFLVQMENVRCPYLFQIITKNEFEDFQRSMSGPPMPTDPVMDSLDFAQTCFGRTLEILEDANSGVLQDNVKESVVNSAWKKISGHKKEVVYLQLLCGWTFRPTVTYKIETNSYSEETVKYAKVGAEVCTVAIKLATLWNTASSVGALMFGCPVAKIPKEEVAKVKEFLEHVNESSPVKDLKEKAGNGMNLAELDDFGDFLDKLEKGGMMRQMDGVFDKKALRGKTWMDALSKETSTTKEVQITYVSKELPRLKQQR